MNWRGLRGWKKGAIVGGVWGSILGNFVYWLVGMFYWERTPPRFVEEFLRLIVYLPEKIFSKVLHRYYDVYEMSTYIILYFGLNFFGWIIIGAIVGHLYGRSKERES